MDLNAAVQDWAREKFAAKTAWDEPPQLLFLYEMEGGSKVENGRSVIPEAVWDLGRPPAILYSMAESLGQDDEILGMIAQGRPETLCGIAFACEAWTVNVEGLTEQERDEVHEQSQEHTMHTRADRIEVAFIGAHTVDGPFYAQMIRGREPEFFPQESDMQGTVPESLALLYKQIVAL